MLLHSLIDSVPCWERDTGCSGKIVSFYNSLQPLPRLHRCKRVSKLSTQCECTIILWAGEGEVANLRDFLEKNTIFNEHPVDPDLKFLWIQGKEVCGMSTYRLLILKPPVSHKKIYIILLERGQDSVHIFSQIRNPDLVFGSVFLWVVSLFLAGCYAILTLYRVFNKYCVFFENF